MPYKNKEDKLARDRMRYQQNKDRYREARARAAKNYTKKHAERLKQERAEKYQQNRAKILGRRHVVYDEFRRRCVDYLGSKCEMCGLQDEYVGVYDFHHRDPDGKDFSISGHSKAWTPWEKITQELDKCQLLCATCHRRAHRKISAQESHLGKIV